MDALLQLLVPEVKLLDGLERHQRVLSWDGAEYPQDPITYGCGPHVELITSQIQPFLLQFLPDGFFKEHWTVLDVSGAALDLLEQETNGEDVDWFDCRLEDLLVRFLTQYEQWALIFELHYDQIDNIYRLSPDECIHKLKVNLSRTSRREGFIALSP